MLAKFIRQTSVRRYALDPSKLNLQPAGFPNDRQDAFDRWARSIRTMLLPNPLGPNFSGMPMGPAHDRAHDRDILRRQMEELLRRSSLFARMTGRPYSNTHLAESALNEAQGRYADWDDDDPRIAAFMKHGDFPSLGDAAAEQYLVHDDPAFEFTPQLLYPHYRMLQRHEHLLPTLRRSVPGIRRGSMDAILQAMPVLDLAIQQGRDWGFPQSAMGPLNAPYTMLYDALFQNHDTREKAPAAMQNLADGQGQDWRPDGQLPEDYYAL